MRRGRRAHCPSGPGSCIPCPGGALSCVTGDGGTCTCDTWICGDGVRQGSEICDGPDSLNCTGQCRPPGHSLGGCQFDDTVPPSPGIDTGQVDKNRYLCITLPDPAAAEAGPYAVRVRLMNLQNPVPPNSPCCPPPNFDSYEGEDRWVGAPAEYAESAENPGGPKFNAALLQCTPRYRADWHTFGTIYMAGAEVRPSSSYEVHTVAQSSSLASIAGISMVTKRWGDMVADFCDSSACPTTQPDFMDISAVVDKFKSVPTAPIRARAQLQPRVPDLTSSVSFLDISSCVDDFKGLAYPAAWGPCPCLSTAVCPTLDECGRCGS